MLEKKRSFTSGAISVPATADAAPPMTTTANIGEDRTPPLPPPSVVGTSDSSSTLTRIRKQMDIAPIPLPSNPMHHTSPQQQWTVNHLKHDLLHTFNRIIEEHNIRCESVTRTHPVVSVLHGNGAHTGGDADKSYSTLSLPVSKQNSPSNSPMRGGNKKSSAAAPPIATATMIPALSTLDPDRLKSAFDKLRLEEFPTVLFEVVNIVIRHLDKASASQQAERNGNATSTSLHPHAVSNNSLSYAPSMSHAEFTSPMFMYLPSGTPHVQNLSRSFDPTAHLRSPTAFPPVSPPIVVPARRATLLSTAGREISILNLGKSHHSQPQQQQTTAAAAAAAGDASAVSTSVTPSSMDTSLTSVRPTPKLTIHLERFTDDEGFTTINNYVLIEEAGAGKFGRVCVASLYGTSELRAIKIVPKRKLRQRWHQLRQFPNDQPSETTALHREVAIMKRLRHKHVVPLYEVIDDPEEQNLYLVMKYIEKGPIVRLDETWGCSPLDLDLVRCVMRQTASGVAYLHRHHIAHRDIKPDNILLGADGNVYLADFGVSQIFEKNDDHISSSDGTPAYAAPEIVKGDGDYSAMKADIWALGVTMYTIVFGKPPFYAPSIFELNERIANQEISFDVDLTTMNPDHDYDEAIMLLKRMLCRDPQQRVSAKDVCEDPFLTRGRVSKPSVSPQPPTVPGPRFVPLGLISSGSDEPTEEELRASFTPLVARPPASVRVSTLLPYKREWVTFE